MAISSIRLFHSLALLLLATLAFYPKKAFSTPHPLRPAIFAVLVGNNQGNQGDRPLRYAQSDASRLYQTLREVGGVSKQRIRLLLGKDPQALWQALQQIDKQIRAIRQLHPHRATRLLFYYSGHADQRALHLGQENISYKRLRDTLKHSFAHLRILVLDTCQSGQMIRLKGSSRLRASVQMNLDQAQTKGARRTKRTLAIPPAWQDEPLQGEAILTASGIGEDAHELESLRGSIFTHHLLSALRGLADHNQDGHVTLEEAYGYTYQKTISHTLFLSSGVQHPSFRKAFRGHGHVILTSPHKAPAQLALDTPMAGNYYILQPEKQLLLAEIKKKRGERVHVGLEAGKYTIVYRSKGGYQSQTIGLHKGKTHLLTHLQGRMLSYAAASNKGIAWLTHPPRLHANTPYLTAFYATLGVAIAGAITTATLYGVSHKLYGEARAPLEQPGGTGVLDQSLVDASSQTNVGASAMLGLTIAATIAATTLFILHGRKAQSPNHSQTPPSSVSSSRGHLSTSLRTLRRDASPALLYQP
ncbi:MAG: caspase family protein [Myxococcales bacterium]|nr:caspase family protein [Myxococcales bacterium]MCB9643316.1 caspase family protein [Myxococcales bacterium]